MTYLDYASTTPVDERVLKEMLPYFNEKYGNPSSIHTKGQENRNAIEQARETIAKAANCKAEEVIFTAGGTASINLAILGTAEANPDKKHIIISATEHKAVMNTVKHLQKKGYEITIIPVDQNGLLNINEFEKSIKANTLLASIMQVNNETGATQLINEIAKICKQKGILLHTDACQAGYLGYNTNADLITINSSKIYGPKGIGALIYRNLRIKPILHGGPQEKGLNPGTENVPGIIGFAKAIELIEQERKQEHAKLQELRSTLIEKLTKIPGTTLNGNGSPHIANFSFKGIEGESLALRLDEKGVQVATGSACSSTDLEPSHVLLAMGKTREQAHGSIRISIGRYTTKEEIEIACQVIEEEIKQLRRFSAIQ